MAYLLTGSITTKDGVTHPNAIALISDFRVKPSIPVPSASFANVNIDYYHDKTSMLANLETIYFLSLIFVVGGDPNASDPRYPFEQVFIFNPAKPNQVLNLFNYLQTLPQFIGWVVTNGV